MLTRILIERSGGSDKWRLRAVVCRKSRRTISGNALAFSDGDSIHGPFRGTIVLDEAENAFRLLTGT